MSLAIGLGIGASAVVGRCLGSAQHEKAREAATVINYISLTLGIVTALLLYVFMDRIFLAMGASAVLETINQYMVIWLPGSVLVVCMMTANSVLRACGNTKTPSIVMAGAGLVNALLDPLLILEPDRCLPWALPVPHGQPS